MMSTGKRAAVVLLLLALGLCASVALAAPGDPQKKYTKAGQAQARTVALRRADFPAGWIQKPKQKQSNSSNPRCSYYNPDQSDLVEIGEYDSPDFDLPDGSSVSSSTGVFRTMAMARSGYARVAQPALPKCLAELFTKGAKPSKTTIFSAAPIQFPRYGDRSNAYRITASVKTPTARIRVVLDVVLFNRGPIDVAVLTLGIGHPLPAELEQSLVAKVAARSQ